MLETINHVLERCEYEIFYSKQKINIMAKAPVRYSYCSSARANRAKLIHNIHILNKPDSL